MFFDWKDYVVDYCFGLINVFVKLCECVVMKFLFIYKICLDIFFNFDLIFFWSNLKFMCKGCRGGE